MSDRAAAGSEGGDILAFDRFVLDCADQRLLGPDGAIRLGRKAFGTLCLLARQSGRLVTKEMMLDTIWESTTVSESALTSVIKELRRALGDDVREPRFIESVYGRGYRFLPAVGPAVVTEITPARTVADAQPVPAVTAPVGVTRTRRPSGIFAGALLLILAAGAGALGYFAGGRHAASPNGAATMQVQLLDFERLSPDIPPAYADAIRDETLAAFGDDGTVQVRMGADPAVRDGVALGGSVRHVGGALRIALYLRGGKERAQLWSHLLEFPFDNGNDAPRRVAITVASFARCVISAASTGRTSLPDNGLALLAKLCGYRIDLDDDAMRAVVVARALSRAAPDFSRGWSALAAAAERRIPQLPPAARGALTAEGLAAARTALTLDPHNSEALVEQAVLMPRTEMAQRGALYTRALDTTPFACGCENIAFGNFMIEAGLLQAALDHFAQAAAMNALSAEAHERYAFALLVAGEDGAAAAHLARARDLDPASPSADKDEIFAALWTKRYDDVAAVLARPRSAFAPLEKDALTATFQSLRTGTQFDRDRAVALIAAAIQGGAAPSREIIAALAALGEDREALMQTQRLAGPPPHAIGELLFSPIMAGARKLPEFAPLLRRLGLPDYWRDTGQKPDFCVAASPPELCGMLQRTSAHAGRSSGVGADGSAPSSTP